MSKEKVTPLLAAQIRRDLERCKAAIRKTEEGRREWIEANYDLCIHLAQAKRDNPATQDFGQWCADNGFGEDVISEHIRIAAIAMAREPEVLRKCLEETNRLSLETIHKFEFPRVANVRDSANHQKKPRRTPKQSPQILTAREAVRSLVEQDAAINREGLAKELGVSEMVIREARQYEQGYLDAKREVEPIALAEMKPSLRERYEAALRVAKKQIRGELMAEVRAEVYAIYDGYLKQWKPDIERAERIIAARKGVISRKDFRIVLAGLHPDHNKFEQAREAFEAFKSLEDVLVKPDAPTLREGTPPLPATVEEMMARRRTSQR